MDFATAQQQYLDNVDYDDNNSLAQARLYRQAIRALLAMPTEHRQGRGGTVFNRSTLQGVLAQVNRYIAENDDSASPEPLYLNNQDFRQ